MARPRDPRRDEAKRIWLESGGEIKLKDIAEKLGCSDSQIRKWKNQDKWENDLNGNVTKLKSNVTKHSRGSPGAPKGNKNAVGNEGGAPKGNTNAMTHGFFRTIFPDDEETMQIVEAIQEKSPIDIIWENIIINYTAIARAQKVMFVESKDEMIKELKKRKYDVVPKGEEFEQVTTEEEYEFQFAWDRHATFLNAQSRAMSELRGLIKDFLMLSGQDDMRRLQLEKMQQDINKSNAEIEKLKADGENNGVTNLVVQRWSNHASDS